MSREINSTQPYSDKVVKLIPSEIVGAYMVIAGILGFMPDPVAGSATSSGVTAIIPEPDLKRLLIQFVFVFLLVVTPLYMWRVGRVKNKLQLVVTTVSFAVWVYTLGGPFVVWDLYYPLVGSVLLILWSLTIPMIFPPTKKAQKTVSAGGGTVAST